MKIKREYIFLGLIVLIAVVLRFWQIGQVPISPDWDEAALGYNAYSILETGRDEYGKPTPIVLQSFNDYKPALYAYLIIPFIKVMGLSVEAVRLPSAIFGVSTIVAVYFLVKQLFDKKEIALLCTFLLAISPWHIQFSRVAFESNIGLSLNIFLILFFLKSLKNKVFIIPAAVMGGLNLYVYQADRLFTPLLVLVLAFVYRKELLKMSKKYLSVAIIVGLIIALPMIIFTFTNKEALARAQGASILNAPIPLSNFNLAVRNLTNKENHDLFGLIVDNRRAIYFKELIGNYLWHYDFNWLFIQGESANPLNVNLRHQAIGMGNLYLFELPFLLIGIYILLFGNFRKSTKLLLFLWFAIVPIPASITWDVPNSVRTLNFLPTFQILIALGILSTYDFLKKYRFSVLAFFAIGVVGIFNFIYYLDAYFVQYNYLASQYWQYGYEKLIPYLKSVEGRYDRIVVFSKIPLDQSYIFFLFYLKYPPRQYQENNNSSGEYKSFHKIGKYEFRDSSLTVAEEDTQRILYVGGVSDALTTKRRVIHTINFFDGTPGIQLADKKL